jgi:hydroxypyruvate reductase/glycerate 2-kinase
MSPLATDALTIWRSAIDAVQPRQLVADAVRALNLSGRVIGVGGGKAGAEMALGLEQAISTPHSIEGLVNIPAPSPLTPPLPREQRGTNRIRLHPARPAASNFPTAAGVAGVEEMLRLLASTGSDDTAICLISGGGSALLPCPADGVTLESKLAVTKLLHGCGATIHEMNCVRKHLSRVKGGRLAEAFRGQQLISLIISDVVGDPLDVIASGPTAPDPTTFADAKTVLERYRLWAKCPPDVTAHIQKGCDGAIPDTPKTLPPNVRNVVIGNNAVALAAARRTAEQLRYRVLDLGPFVEGETRDVAAAIAGIVRNIHERGEPIPPPACILIGGETTVTLGENPGQGGRNQEFVLAMLERLGSAGMRNVAVLSGGTDGEDGPTDAAGAVADEATPLNGVLDALTRHDAYPFFDAVGGLIRTGPTGTNVADVRVILLR